jgi:pimeloyl-ACP methyl ester carboxylesterase
MGLLARLREFAAALLRRKPPAPPTAPAAPAVPALARANGIDIAYETFGRAGDPALLLIMGFAQPMIEWDEEFCARLAARGYHVVRFDNRDVGRSTHLPRGASYKLADMADDTAGLLDALHIRQAHVVGVSMGGMIAQLLAVHHPERVLSLTSMMSTTGDLLLPPPTPAAMRALMDRPPPDREGFAAYCRSTWRTLRGSAFPLDEARDQRRAQRLYDYGLNPAGAGRQLMAVSISGSRRRLLDAVKHPTLVIHGEADPLIPVAHGKATAEAIPNAKLKIIPDMGHALTMEHWDELIDAIAEHAR